MYSYITAYINRRDWPAYFQLLTKQSQSVCLRNRARPFSHVNPGGNCCTSSRHPLAFRTVTRFPDCRRIRRNPCIIPSLRRICWPQMMLQFGPDSTQRTSAGRRRRATSFLQDLGSYHRTLTLHEQMHMICLSPSPRIKHCCVSILCQ